MKVFSMSTRALVGAMMLASLLAGSAVSGTAEYAVRPDDKLKIKIFQYPELSGEYSVSSNGTLTIGPIGEFTVNGSSPGQIAKLISDRFIRSGLSDKPGTTVDILQSRPIYVMGDVQKPGEYPYRPGLTVLQAVSLAGGWMRFNDPGLMRFERDNIQIRGEMRNLVRRYYVLLAQRARLNAELALKADVSFPPELVRQYANDRGLAELVDEERSLLGIHVAALKTQLDSLEKTRNLYEREIETVSHQIQASKVEYETMQSELDKVKALYARGLATGLRKADLERTLAQIEVSEQGFQTLILRARQNITQVDLKIFDLKSQHHATISSDMQRTRLELEEISVKFDTNRSILVEAQLTAPTLVSSVDEGAIGGRSLTVVRVQDGKPLTLDAEEHMILLPGDVLKIQRSVIPSAMGPDRIPVRGLISHTAVHE
jgi:polysaccharide biosynthesis/export protein ExoF